MSGEHNRGGQQENQSILMLLANYASENATALEAFFIADKSKIGLNIVHEIEDEFDKINQEIDRLETRDTTPTPEMLSALHQRIQAVKGRLNNELGIPQKPEAIN